MNKAFSVLLLMVCLGLAQRSFAEFVVEVTRGQDNAVPIAIVPFAAAGASDLDVAQVVSNDLARSGRFKAMDRKDMVEEPHVGANITFDDWRRLGNDYVVVGLMTPQGPDRYNISFELYNVLNHQRLLGFQIAANHAGLRLASHQIADMIFDKITGIRGAFATRIAYVSVAGSLPNRSYRLIVADADGENPHVVMQSNEPLMSPAWSPDGQSLAYVSFEHRVPTVYVQYLKTGDRHVVSAKAGVNQAPAWSPDGKKLALTLSTRDGNLDVYVLDLATDALTRVTDDPAIDTEPQWSRGRAEPVFHLGPRGRPADLQSGSAAGRSSAPPDVPGELQRQAARFPRRVAARFRDAGGGSVPHRRHGPQRSRRRASAHQGAVRRIAELCAERCHDHLCEPRPRTRRARARHPRLARVGAGTGMRISVMISPGCKSVV